MFVRDQPHGVRPSKASGRTDPECDDVPALRAERLQTQRRGARRLLELTIAEPIFSDLERQGVRRAARRSRHDVRERGLAPSLAQPCCRASPKEAYDVLERVSSQGLACMARLRPDFNPTTRCRAW